MRAALEKDISIVQVIADNDVTGKAGIYNDKFLCDMLGKRLTFAEYENFSLHQGALMGLYYQLYHVQGTLISVRKGRVFCVAVDVKKGSPYIGRWISAVLSEENNKQMWIPEGFARGWLSLTDETVVNANYTKPNIAKYRRCISCEDNFISIKWPLIPYEFPIAIGHTQSIADKECYSFYNAELIEV